MLQSLMLSKELAVFDERTRLQLSTMSADVLVKLAQKKLTDQQAKTEIQKTLLNSLDATGKRISNNIADRTAEYLVEKAKNESYHSNPLQAADELIGRLLGKDWR